MSVFTDLDKRDFTLAGFTVSILNGHLSVVLDPALAAQDVMDARRHLVPFVVVPEPVYEHKSTLCSLCMSIPSNSHIKPLCKH